MKHVCIPQQPLILVGGGGGICALNPQVHPETKDEINSALLSSRMQRLGILQILGWTAGL
jgi:hypothetical protein